MPLYEYVCESCHEKFEQLVPSFRSQATCPKCGSHEAEKLLSTFAMSHGGGSGEAPRMPAMAGGGGGCCGGGCGCH